jgi:hypothetical protein
MCDMHVCNADGNFPYQVCLNCGLRRGMLWFGIYAWKTKVINILENKTAKKKLASFQVLQLDHFYTYMVVSLFHFTLLDLLLHSLLLA